MLYEGNYSVLRVVIALKRFKIVYSPNDFVAKN